MIICRIKMFPTEKSFLEKFSIHAIRLRIPLSLLMVGLSLIVITFGCSSEKETQNCNPAGYRDFEHSVPGLDESQIPFKSIYGAKAQPFYGFVNGELVYVRRTAKQDILFPASKRDNNIVSFKNLFADDSGILAVGRGYDRNEYALFTLNK